MRSEKYFSTQTKRERWKKGTKRKREKMPCDFRLIELEREQILCTFVVRYARNEYARRTSERPLSVYYSARRATEKGGTKAVNHLTRIIARPHRSCNPKRMTSSRIQIPFHLHKSHSKRWALRSDFGATSAAARNAAWSDSYAYKINLQHLLPSNHLWITYCLHSLESIGHANAFRRSRRFSRHSNRSESVCSRTHTIPHSNWNNMILYIIQ